MRLQFPEGFLLGVSSASAAAGTTGIIRVRSRTDPIRQSPMTIGTAGVKTAH